VTVEVERLSIKLLVAYGRMPERTCGLCVSGVGTAERLGESDVAARH